LSGPSGPPEVLGHARVPINLSRSGRSPLPRPRDARSISRVQTLLSVSLHHGLDPDPATMGEARELLLTIDRGHLLGLDR